MLVRSWESKLSLLCDKTKEHTADILILHKVPQGVAYKYNVFAIFRTELKHMSRGLSACHS